MSDPGPSPESLRRVAERALLEVRPGMRLGLGTGRAAEAFIRALGERARAGLDVSGVPTSERSLKLAGEVGVKTLTLEEAVNGDRSSSMPTVDLRSMPTVDLRSMPRSLPLDIAFDGADEVADGAGLPLTKGLGGAQLRERVVANIAKRFVILATAEKRVAKLGSRCPIPIEVVPFALPAVRAGLEALGARPVLRLVDGVEDHPYRADNANLILDAHVKPLDDPKAFDRAARALPGVVDVGVFLDMASLVLVATNEGVLELAPHA